MKVEVLDVGLAGAGGGDPRGIRVRADAADAPTGAGAEGDTAQDGGIAETREQGGLRDERVLRLGINVFADEAASTQQAQDARANRLEETRHLQVGRWRRRVKAKPSFRLPLEHTVENEGVKVHVEIESAAEALDDRNRTATAFHVSRPCLPALEAEKCSHVDGKDRAAQGVIPREDVSQSVGKREHPLAAGNLGEDGVDEVCGLGGHAPAATARADAATLTRERNEALEAAFAATESRKASPEGSASEKVAKLFDDEERKGCTVAGCGGRGEEGLQVGTNELV